ncbi:cytochrome c maturation protein CcmE [Chloroflexota bacterium]
MKKKYVIGGIILALVAGYLIFLSFSSSLSYYVTVSELLDENNNFYDTTIRVAGKVADSDISWDSEELNLSFDIVEGGDELSIIYHGTRPDGLTADTDIVAEGKYQLDGIFHADSLILQCPSKYEIEE